MITSTKQVAIDKDTLYGNEEKCYTDKLFSVIMTWDHFRRLAYRPFQETKTRSYRTFNAYVTIYMY